MLDREIRREDVQSLSSRDQVAAFLATPGCSGPERRVTSVAKTYG